MTIKLLRIRRIALLVLAGVILAHGIGRADDLSAGPRLGKYRIFSYGRVSSPPIFLGHFVLGPAGTYRAFLAGDKPTGEGRYEYDAAKHTVTWVSGPYAKVWGGDFSIEREGKTHKIRMKSTTIATNNAD